MNKGRAWDAKTGTELQEPTPPRPFLPEELSVSPDQRTLAIGRGSRLRLVDRVFSASEIARRLWSTRPDRFWHEERARILTATGQLPAAKFHQGIVVSLLARESLTNPNLKLNRKLVSEWLMNRAIALRQRDDYLILGGFLLRDGRADEAIASLKLALALRSNGSVPTEEMLLALAHHALGQVDEARRKYTIAERWLDRVQVGCRAGNLIGLGTVDAWSCLFGAGTVPGADKANYLPVQDDWLELALLRTEAEALFAGKK
jgi:hypothetical protein